MKRINGFLGKHTFEIGVVIIILGIMIIVISNLEFNEKYYGTGFYLDDYPKSKITGVRESDTFVALDGVEFTPQYWYYDTETNKLKVYVEGTNHSQTIYTNELIDTSFYLDNYYDGKRVPATMYESKLFFDKEKWVLKPNETSNFIIESENVKNYGEFNLGDNYNFGINHVDALFLESEGNYYIYKLYTLN